MGISIRLARNEDIPTIRALIESSVLGLQTADYSFEQLKHALKTVYGVDTRLIADGTYLVAESCDESGTTIVGCGGWSRRKTLYGGDQWVGREDSFLDPARDAAKIRAFFVHPEWARRGIGGIILEACEKAAYTAGFRRLEMGATLTGIPFYEAKGYIALEKQEVPMGEGLTLPIVRMWKSLEACPH